MNLSKTVSTKIHRVNLRGLGEVFDENNELLLEVPFSLPGDFVEYAYDVEGEVNLINFKSTSSHGVKPLCKHFKKCGGCSLQHASENFVASWKKLIVAEELQKKKLFPRFRSTFVTPERSRRRVVLSCRRTKKGAIVGFKSVRSDHIVPIHFCLVVDSKILSFLSGVEKIAIMACSRSSILKVFVSVSEMALM